MSEAKPVLAESTGRLEGLEPAVVACALSDERRSGRLEFARGAVCRVLFLREGRVYFASSTDPNDRLGESLLRQGKIRLDQLEAALTRGCPSQRLGQRLVDAGGLAPGDLAGAVRGQIESIALSTLTWEDGQYSFRDGAEPAAEDLTLDQPTRELALRALRTVTSLGRIRKGLGGPRTVLALSPQASARLTEISLTAGEALVLDHLGAGRRSVDALCREIALSNFEICRTLWAFVLLGVVVPRDRAEDHAFDPAVHPVPGALPALLAELSRVRATGVLHASRGGLERTLHIRDGRPVFATSGALEDGLVAHLFRSGMISLADREEISSRLLSNRRVGAILCDLGAIGEAELRRMVQQQLAAIVHDTLRWESADLTFVPGPLPSQEQIVIEDDPARLVAEGLRGIGSWTRLLAGCGGLDHPLRLTPRYLEVLDRIGAGVEEWDVVQALQAARTVRRVCRAVEHSEFVVCRVLWTLRLFGGVEDAPVEDEFGDDLPGPDAAAPVDVAADAERPAPPPLAFEPVDVACAAEALEAAQPAAESAAAADGAQAGSGAPGQSGPLEEVIVRFNALHREVYRAVRAEIGAGAVNFVRSCCARLASGSADPLARVPLLHDGSWDVEGLKDVLREMRIDDPSPAFRQLLDVEFGSLVPHLGPSRARELRRSLDQLEPAS
jgi:hypothetical protein